MGEQFETLVDYTIRVVTFYDKHFIDKNTKPLKQHAWTADYITNAVNRTLTEVFGDVAHHYIVILVQQLTAMMRNEYALQYFRDPGSVDIAGFDRESIDALNLIECAQLARYCDAPKLRTIMTPSVYDHTLNVRSYLDELSNAGDRLMDELKERYGDTINSFPLCTVIYFFETAKRSRKLINELLRRDAVNMNHVTSNPKDIIVYRLDSITCEVQPYEDVECVVDVIRVETEE